MKNFMENPRYVKALIGVMACVILGLLVYIVAPGRNAPQEPAPSKENEPVAEQPVEEPKAPEPAEPLDAEPQEDIETKLGEIVLAANEYLRDNEKTTSIITQNGILYNAAAKIEVTTDYLRDTEYLSDTYFLDDAMILYVSYDDIAEVTDNYDYGGNSLELFAVVPNGGGYMLASKKQGIFEVDGDRFDSLMEKYNVHLGETRRITGSSEEYAEINEAIKAESGIQADFYVRYGMRNDKYAIVTVSPKTDIKAYYQYILSDDGNGFKVSFSNLEKADKPYVVSNVTHYNFDILLLPNVNMSFYLGMIETEFEGMSESLIRSGMLEPEDDEVEYVAGVADFLFAKYTNGQLFVGHRVNNTWILGGVSTAEQALEFFEQIDERGPSFVIVWE